MDRLPKDMMRYKSRGRAFNALFADVLCGLPVLEDVREAYAEQRGAEPLKPAAPDPLLDQVAPAAESAIDVEAVPVTSTEPTPTEPAAPAEAAAPDEDEPTTEAQVVLRDLASNTVGQSTAELRRRAHAALDMLTEDQRQEAMRGCQMEKTAEIDKAGAPRLRTFLLECLSAAKV